MSNLIYDWERFWCNRSGTFSLTDNGFLYDPLSQYGRIANPGVKTIDELHEIRCIALLGEPGIGKTQALQRIVGSYNAQSNIIFINLRSYGIGSEERLIKELFRNSKFLKCQESNEEVYIFLDSLDECLLRINHMAALIIDELKKYNTKKIYLRIACRTADWPNQFENDLINLWDKDQFRAVELLPLRRCDVVEAARDNNLDFDDFMKGIIQKEIVSFAIKPITLKMLIGIYRKHGQFPETQQEIYLQGCQLLCEEQNDGRKMTVQVDSRKRLTIATRIAALTIFMNKFAIWCGTDYGNIPEEDLRLSDIIDGSDRTLHESFVINEGDLLEVLSSGLFSSRGSNRLGWAHQSYAEFLAALYIIEHQMTYEQTISLIRHPNDEEKKLVPQLYEVSSWIATFNSEIFNYIVAVEPEILLRSDILNAETKIKKGLVQCLLDKYDSGQLHDGHHEINDLLYKLNHDELADQLRIYINDTSKNLFVRRFALRIAKACVVESLQKDILKVALEQNEEYYLRTYASKAFAVLCDKTELIKLLPLAESEAGEDPDDELKGNALQALWPDHISSPKMFSLLTVPKRKNLLGSYYYFLRHCIIPGFKIADLSDILNWTTQFVNAHVVKTWIEDVLHYAIDRGWNEVRNPSITKLYIDLLRVRIKNFDRLNYMSKLKDDELTRKYIIEKLIMTSQSQVDIAYLANSPLVNWSDFSWLLGQTLIEEKAEIQQKYIELLFRIFNWDDSQHIHLLIEAINKNDALAMTFSVYTEPIPLNSDRTKDIKDDYYFHENIRRRSEKKKLTLLPISKRMEFVLNKVEAGDINSWRMIYIELAVDQEGIIRDEHEPNIQNYDNWSTINDEHRNKIIESAHLYIKQADSNKEDWFCTDAIYRSALAGYKALRIIYEFDYSFLHTLTTVEWENWIPVLLSQPLVSSEEKKIQSDLISLAYFHAPEQLISDLLAIMKYENEQHSNIFVNTLVEECWDDRLSKSVFEFLKSFDLEPQAKKTIMEQLLAHQIVGIEDYTKSLIELGINSNDEQFKKNAEMAAIALCNNSINGWEWIWQYKDIHFFKEIILRISDEGKAKLILNSMSESFLSDLYTWLELHFPHREDPGHEDKEMAHFISPREEIAELRDNVLRLLINRGSEQSREAVQRIVNEFPRLTWLKWSLIEAQNATRRNKWIPPRAKDIILLADNKQKRLVQSGNELLVIILDALKKIQKRLHGTTPEVFLLWNNIDKNKCRPRTENEFSDYIKVRLEDEIKGQGIILNREVEIQRTLGSERGERTDIQVDAILPRDSGQYDKLTVIIEVKANWHSELFEAMKMQLADRYLREGKTSYGLFLVGWFASEKWDSNDSRKNKVPQCGFTETNNKLQVQANNLSENKNVKSFVMDVRF
ncbi:NACHT domain-containing protein [Paenibacillus durus]|uniref:Uncharacterized protein n=1 Tax=Paenibacillus durus TaxID=44251 RepID=A0A089HPF1_PAEDU|nr:AAA family ATPase [Paenibacillus durus]AIQ12610.1 hypothetical protein PDUR_12405 [Paenibacillus durus]